MPHGPGAQRLAEADRSEIELVSEGDGLSTMDLSRLRGQMGRNVSTSLLQEDQEQPSQRAIFGRAKWGSATAKAGVGSRITEDTL